MGLPIRGISSEHKSVLLTMRHTITSCAMRVQLSSTVSRWDIYFGQVAKALMKKVSRLLE
jgi:hypothetical protein